MLAWFSADAIFTRCNSIYCTKNRVAIKAVPKPMEICNTMDWLFGRYSSDSPCLHRYGHFLGKYRLNKYVNPLATPYRRANVKPTPTKKNNVCIHPFNCKRANTTIKVNINK